MPTLEEALLDSLNLTGDELPLPDRMTKDSEPTVRAGGGNGSLQADVRADAEVEEILARPVDATDSDWLKQAMDKHGLNPNALEAPPHLKRQVAMMQRIDRSKKAQNAQNVETSPAK